MSIASSCSRSTRRPTARSFYGLRYQQPVVKPGQAKTHHDQVGYWLWDPATGTVIQTPTSPRGQVAMASGQSSADASSFELAATQRLDTWGICSSPFLQHAHQARRA